MHDWPQVVNFISSVAEVDLYDSEDAIPRDVLIKRAGDADGILCMLTDKIDSEVLQAAGQFRLSAALYAHVAYEAKLKVISTMSVGYDHIDLSACAANSVSVGNTPGVLTESTVC